MTFIRTIVNISSSPLFNINRHVNNFQKMPIFCNIFKQNIRTFWFGKCKREMLTFNKEHKHMSGSCRKLPLTRIEPSTGEPSKCLEDYSKPKRSLFKFRKSPVIKEKPTNCKKIEPVKVKPSFWERVCGIHSKKSCPPCICPITYQRQMALRKQDPRLLNPCYQSTLGDVLIYTEIIKTKNQECPEPQPKPHHLYKIPRAVLNKAIVANVEKKLRPYSALQCRNHNKCKSNKFQTNSILFKEMRPTVKEKCAFTCKDGITTNNITQPFNTKMNPYGISFVKVIRNPKHSLNQNLQTTCETEKLTKLTCETEKSTKLTCEIEKMSNEKIKDQKDNLQSNNIKNGAKNHEIKTKEV